MVWNNPLALALLAALAAVAALHLVRALAVDRILEYVEIACPLPKISPALDGYRIAFLTDVHRTSAKELRAVATELRGRGVDLVLFGGDFQGQRDLDACFAILAEIGPRDGFYGVEGNHDRAPELASAMAGRGMTLLENTGVSPQPGLWVAGLEDLWNRTPDLDTALTGAADGDFVLTLAHNPDTSMEVDCSRSDLMLCGHVHGGEVALFGRWAPAMPFVSRYGQRFTSGWCKSAAGTDVYVCNGVGRHIPIRVFARPQVAVLTLRSGRE